MFLRLANRKSPGTDNGLALYQELPRLGADEGTAKTLNTQPTFGQLELLTAGAVLRRRVVLPGLTLTDLLVDFGFFLQDRNTVTVDYSKIKQLSTVLRPPLRGTDSAVLLRGAVLTACTVLP
eukprot:1420413-Rhodomonas_salina.4